ncbi:putative cyclin-D6-1 isoform X1 [Telopea speciosissima]|uniref:putative cyclin-D6-1 isoform X1 n=1 Tax=Telopea speciosissima TaxID=54955 RepID=UPI001CC62F16|nr:putative cyclin-D6-1 isoform X1 [Telopea speciosissima]
MFFEDNGFLPLSSSSSRLLNRRVVYIRETMEEFDLENPLTSSQDQQSDTMPALFAAESDHMPSDGFKTRDLDVSVRREAIALILQAQFSCRFDPFLHYLAVNYLDRFISRQEMPQGKPWILKLVAMSCLSLAAKMNKTDFSLTDFQRGDGFIFDTQTIQRMEFLILGALKWRMRSITPFSFVHFFLSLFKLKDPPLRDALKARAKEIIFKAQNEMKLIEFKPSIIAASALLSASHELFPIQFPCFRKAIFSCEYVNEVKLFDCCNVMQGIVMDGYESVLSSSDTPVNVLDLHCSSSESEKTISIGTTTIRAERDLKRRKISDFCNKKTFQLSQIQHC